MRTVGMILSAIIGAVVGAGLMVLMSRVVESSRHPVDTLATDIEAIEVNSALARALDLTTEAAVIVGPHDEVLHTTLGARSMELVRGSRIANETLLKLVRTARREGRDIVDTMEMKRASTGADSMIGKAEKTLADRDAEAAESLASEDSKMDDLRRDQFRLLLGDDWTYGVESAVDTALLGRYYERIADHAVAVGSRVIYIVTGEGPAGEDWPSAY